MQSIIHVKDAPAIFYAHCLTLIQIRPTPWGE